MHMTSTVLSSSPMKVLLCSLFLLLLPWCDGPGWVVAIGLRGSFEVLEVEGVLQTARCSKTVRGKGGKLLAIDVRPGSNLSTYVVRTNTRQNITALKPDYTSHCAAENDEMSLGISCLKSPLLDLTRESLICDYREEDGAGFTSPPVMINTTAVHVMDCRLQEGIMEPAKTAAPDRGLAVQQSYNVQIDTGRVRLESKDVSSEAFSKLVVCKRTAKPGGLVLCRKSISSLTVIVTRDALDNTNHVSLQCHIQKDNVSVWSKTASIDKPNDSSLASAGYNYTIAVVFCGILALLLVGVSIYCVILFITLKRRTKQKANTSATAQKLLNPDLESPETSPPQ